MKTIRMPKELLAKWLAALRSGGYEQGRYELRTEFASGGSQYCCLGVLQMVADGDVERDEYGVPRCDPSRAWLRKHGVLFWNEDGAVARNPYLPALLCGAVGANDDSEHPFAEIADAIEACAEGY